MQFLRGYKTYIVAGAFGALAFAQVSGLISGAQAQVAQTFLAGLGLTAVRLAISGDAAAADPAAK